MPTRKEFHVIQGGKPADARGMTDVAPLLERTSRFRHLLSLSPSDEISALVNDMEDAIKALQRLERSLHPDARRRAVEYRRLIDEIDAEILMALKSD